MGITIDPSALYAEHTLRVHGIDEEVLKRARRNGLLPCSDLGGGVRVYRGSDLLAWIEGRRLPEGQTA
jgi:hypothetical protein